MKTKMTESEIKELSERVFFLGEDVIEALKVMDKVTFDNGQKEEVFYLEELSKQDKKNLIESVCLLNQSYLEYSKKEENKLKVLINQYSKLDFLEQLTGYNFIGGGY